MIIERNASCQLVLNHYTTYCGIVQVENLQVENYAYWRGEKKERSKILLCSATAATLVCFLQNDLQRDDISWLGNNTDSSLELSLSPHQDQIDISLQEI